MGNLIIYWWQFVDFSAYTPSLLVSFSYQIFDDQNHFSQLKGTAMKPNPALKKLGFSENERLVIIHVDDIGMCQASVAAFADLWDFGLVSSGAVMVPCPWFLEAAKYASQHPQADLGVHLTLNCEWDTYRWGPLSTCDPQTGLLDAQ